MEMNTDRAWLHEKAAAEDGCEIGVGGAVPERAVFGIPGVSRVAERVGDKFVERSFVISTANADPIVTIHFDGRVEVNPKYTTEAAAKVFWAEVEKHGVQSRREAIAHELDCLAIEAAPAAGAYLDCDEVMGRLRKRAEFIRKLGAR